LRLSENRSAARSRWGATAVSVGEAVRGPGSPQSKSTLFPAPAQSAASRAPPPERAFGGRSPPPVGRPSCICLVSDRSHRPCPHSSSRCGRRRTAAHAPAGSRTGWPCGQTGLRSSGRWNRPWAKSPRPSLFRSPRSKRRSGRKYSRLRSVAGLRNPSSRVAAAPTTPYVPWASSAGAHSPSFDVGSRVPPCRYECSREEPSRRRHLGQTCHRGREWRHRTSAGHRLPPDGEGLEFPTKKACVFHYTGVSV
jgi:hypothetical protein